MEIKNGIEVSVPGRICLFGDKIDLLEKPVIGAAINALMYTKLAKRNDDIIEFYSEDLDFYIKFKLSDATNYNHLLGYWSAVVDRLKTKITGFSASVRSDIPIGAGLSSSAAVTISLIKGLMKLFEFEMTTDEIAEMAYKCEHDDLGIMCGRLDQYTIAYGGVVYIETGDETRVTRLKVGDLPLVVGDSQEERKASIVLNRIKKNILNKDTTVMNAFAIMEDIVEKGKFALIADDYKLIGELMTKQQKQENILMAATDKLNLLCEKAIESGALGAKQMGAGGGGCMLAICPKKEKEVFDALKKAGAAPQIYEIYNYNNHT